tara:strand:- start:1006 stop:1293 length:288 start_codon:yes stop_codon:yes gene_type:complete
MFNLSTGTIGDVGVVTSNNGGHTPEQITEMCVDKLVHVADSAPPAIREQARAFKQIVQEVVYAHINEAVKNDRLTVKIRLKNLGYSEIAKHIGEL